MSDTHGPLVLMVASEMFPLIKTGGLGDVMGALPIALQEHGVKAVTLLPGYPAVMAGVRDARPVLEIDDLFGGGALVLAARAADHDLLVIEAPHLFDRPGNPYLGPDGQDWPDNAFRFGALGWVAALIGRGEVAELKPDIVHCHDWQAGLTLAYLAYGGTYRPASVFTIHNLLYQGQFPAELLNRLKLPASGFRVDGFEYHGTIGFLKAGLQFADRITTVSPTYAAEIQTPANGFGLDGLLRARSSVMTGIINGIDAKVWDPLQDTHIPERYGRTSLSNRAANKAYLQQCLGLEEDASRLLFGVVSRLTWQKGIDILAKAVPALLDTGAQLAVLGTGDHELECRLSSLAADHPGRVGCILDYSEDMAHLIQAGSDSMLVPSRFEPCGLTQLCALRYGAIPLVAKVGGLADTVLDSKETAAGESLATGFHFFPICQETLEACLRRVAALWLHKSEWRHLQVNGMCTDVSWRGPARQYARLYADLLSAKN